MKRSFVLIAIMFLAGAVSAEENSSNSKDNSVEKYSRDTPTSSTSGGRYNMSDNSYIYLESSTSSTIQNPKEPAINSNSTSTTTSVGYGRRF